jgi:tetratricopeptide (TPR) repeat protein
MIELSEAGDEDAIFAHRHLAELLIEEHPWRAALHLRRLGQYCGDDDVVHALMGLCQALLGNFHCAVAAYRRALALAPRNPWYHHNLGHLLDVALCDPRSAYEHLRAAHIMEPVEHEITASLAHCLAKLSRVDEALELAEEAVDCAPDNDDHRALLEWIESGAPADVTPRSARDGRPRSRRRGDSRTHEVLQAIERGMREAGWTADQVDCARALWSDYRDGRRLRVVKPEAYAAAVEYAIARVHRIDGVTQASIARRYGIAPTTLASRYGDIRDALALRPGDPRYAS